MPERIQLDVCDLLAALTLGKHTLADKVQFDLSLGRGALYKSIYQ